MSTAALIGGIALMMMCSSSSAAAALMMGDDDTGSLGPGPSSPGPAPPPPPEDCEYIEKDEYGPCTSIYDALHPDVRRNTTIPQCGETAGKQYKEIEVTKGAKYGGRDCPFRGEERTCAIECKDCAGEFKPLTKGFQKNLFIRRNWATSRYDVTSPPGPGGNPCPYEDEQKISIIDNRLYAGAGNSINYDYGTKCGKFVGTEGDASMDDVFGTLKTKSEIQDFDENIKSYHVEYRNDGNGDRVWCAVHK